MWLQIQNSEAVDRLIVDGRHARRDRWWTLVVDAIRPFLGAITVLVVMSAWKNPSLGTLLTAFFLPAVLFAVWRGLSHLHSETVIEVRADTIIATAPSIPGRHWRCDRQQLERLSFEFWGAPDDGETVATVNLVRRAGNPLTRRCMLGNALHIDHRQELFDALAKTLNARGYDCEILQAVGS